MSTNAKSPESLAPLVVDDNGLQTFEKTNVRNLNLKGDGGTGNYAKSTTRGLSALISHECSILSPPAYLP